MREYNGVWKTKRNTNKNKWQKKSHETNLYIAKLYNWEQWSVSDSLSNLGSILFSSELKYNIVGYIYIPWNPICILMKFQFNAI